MKRSDIVHSIRVATGMNIKTSKIALETVIECISESLERNEIVTLRGFGTFFNAFRNAKKVGNINNKPFIMAAHLKTVFKPCKKLTKAVNKVTND